MNKNQKHIKKDDKKDTSNKNTSKDSTANHKSVLLDYEDSWKNHVISETKKNIFSNSQIVNNIDEANLVRENLRLKLNEYQNVLDSLKIKEEEINKTSKDELTSKYNKLHSIKLSKQKELDLLKEEVRTI